MGLHSDDEADHIPGLPIFSISWGGERRFQFQNKALTKLSHYVYLNEGDLLLMGGTCQQTHKHGVPAQLKKDPPTSNRINFTVRAFRK